MARGEERIEGLESSQEWRYRWNHSSRRGEACLSCVSYPGRYPQEEEETAGFDLEGWRAR